MLIVSILLVFWSGYIDHSEDQETVLDAFNFPSDSLDFDMQKWSNPTDSMSNMRQYMLKDLTANHLKEGLDTMVIKDLLGEPLPWPRSSKKYFYSIEQESYKPMYLVITWDDNGKTLGHAIRPLDNSEDQLVISALQPIP